MGALATIDTVETYRDNAAKRIKELMVTWTANTLALGRELVEAEETFPVNPKRPYERPGFLRWAIKTTGLSKGHITNLIQIYQKFGGRAREPRMSSQVMKILSRNLVPETARLEAISRSEKGERLSSADAKKIAKAHKLPTPKEANQQAKEEGTPVLASDGYIYFGTDPGRAKEGEDRRTMVYGVRKALNTLAGIHLTGRQFLDYAMPHQLWTVEEQHVIKDALKWLQGLSEAWEARE
jgi:hypothetical protein